MLKLKALQHQLLKNPSQNQLLKSPSQLLSRLKNLNPNLNQAALSPQLRPRQLLLQKLPRHQAHQTKRHEETATSPQDRKSTRLNSSHVSISYAVFCLKKKKKTTIQSSQQQER